jgi:hypothetical protein
MQAKSSDTAAAAAAVVRDRDRGLPCNHGSLGLPCDLFEGTHTLGRALSRSYCALRCSASATLGNLVA